MKPPAPEDDSSAREGSAASLFWPRNALGLVVWGFILALATLVLWRFRDGLDEAHKTLAFLLLVLVASARSGRAVGLILAAVSFVLFNFLLLPPYYTLALEDPRDWWILVGFLLTAGMAAQLFHKTQEARVAAEHRAREAERFTSLAAESLAAPTAADAVRAVARVMRAELPIHAVQVFGVADSDGAAPTLVAGSPNSDRDEAEADLMRFAVQEGRMVALETNGTSHLAPQGADLASLLVGVQTHAAVLIPLRVRDRAVGVIRIVDPAGLRFDAAQSVFAEGLAGYAGLAVERARLVGEAERVVALDEADRLKDALIASVSHDLRTPLTTIRALASEMRGQDERAGIIESEADRLNRLVTDLLDLSRIRAGALPLDLQIVAAEDLVGAALQRVAGIPGADRVVVSLPADGSIPAGRMDFVQSLRALANLLENALQHSPPGQVVELDVRVEGTALLIRVLDRGPGIPSDERDRIFEPFNRGATASSTDRRGTGLGLAIARSVAEAQGGSVEHCERPGGGSVFVLELAAEVVKLD